jgi:serine/threonine-protein kinase
MKDQNHEKTHFQGVLAQGMMVSHYRIAEKIGSGGMGEVYRAVDTKLNRNVALKFLSPGLCTDEECCRRFASEAQTAACLDHPNIVTIYEVGDFEGHPFFSMQYLEGESLRDILSRGYLDLEETFEILVQVCEGLHEAHSRGVIHRDLKPANIIVTSRRRVKILDFGLAKVLRNEEQTQSGTLIGTVNYMSPEQVNAKPLDHRSDIFSVGVVLYEMLTGINPFVRRSIPATIHAIAMEDPPEVFSHRHTIPPECQAIVRKLLAKRPGARYSTIADLLSDLRQVRTKYTAASSEETVRLYQTYNPIAHDQPSIAVLPFVNMSPNPDNAYFADGLSEELLNVLTKIKQLRVMARTSSFVFKNTRKDIREIGRDLNVGTILEGSVRMSGDRIRVSVQLIKVEDGYHLWSETYDRTLDDILVVQDDIARSVVQEMRAALLGEEVDSSTGRKAQEEVALAVRGRGESPEAQRLYLRGKYHVERLTREDVARALTYFQRAVDLDPMYAMAWVGLSRAYADQAGHGWMPGAEGFAQSRAAAQRALEVEPGLAEGYMRMGLIHMSYDYDWERALNAVQHALELAPGKESVLSNAAHLASNLNQLDEAISLMRQVTQLDPLSSTAHHSLGIYCYSADRLAEADVALKTALELNPRQVGLWFDYARVHLAQGYKERALYDTKQEVFEPYRLLGLAIVHHSCGNVGESDSAVNDLMEKYSADGSYQIAEAFAFRGESDQAFEWLNRAYAQRDPGLAEMRAEPLLRKLHADPRWQNLMEKLRFSK